MLKTASWIRQLKLFLILACLLIAPIVAKGAPWLNSTNSQLHYDLVTLTEWGYIDAAINTFPLPWQGIKEQINSLNTNELPVSAAIAAHRLKKHLHQQSSNKASTLKLYLATDNNRFSHFSTPQHSKTQLNFSQEFNSGPWSIQLSANKESNNKHHFDQSFVSYTLDNWQLRIGAINQWWGPAQSSSLILSNNARPIPAIAISRSQAVTSKSAWLSWLGPWFFTAQLGQLEQHRKIENTKLWLSRFSFKPTKNLEIGASWTAMWGGQGQGNSLRDFFNVVTFKAECVNGAAHCDDALHTKKGNHLAGFDLKYSILLFEQTINLYAQRIGEDAIDYYRVTDQASLFGISTYLGSAKLYIETSDTNVACGNDHSTTKNCYYEHGTYQSGYRFHQRAIGSTFDSDANMFTAGLNKHYIDGSVIEVFFRKLQLNPDKTKASPVVNGSTEKLLQLGGFYQTTLGNWQLKLGGTIEKSKINQQQSHINSMFYSEIQYLIE
ncbi:capsule assembly Wzi family protein [Paraglaciecola aquimarina]|uniref:Capsule assembly Wzi family protein n=1 Tax=Paraglaciecola aquimarina TaxID=1235557 RepID=A0ABU3STR2_9ALTE|nr:capsule assembly Wzi family protein [Paraglaciecola aquimarina]MDU0353393.1 capsule assembly Wzi family protein [Paraglaciecola aquimarina]